MSNQVPAKRFIAQGVQNNGTGPFFAQYAAPGQHVRAVFNDFGQPMRFDTAEAAEIMAMRTLLASLNSRERIIHRYRREIMGPDEFAVRFSKTGIALEEFAILTGSRPSRIREMLTGMQDVPFWFWWGLPALADKKLAQFAMEQCEPHILDRETEEG